MKKVLVMVALALTLLVQISSWADNDRQSAVPELNVLGTYEAGIFDESAAEIIAYDAGSQRIFVTNSGENTIDVIGISDPANPALNFQIDLSPYGGAPNSVAVHPQEGFVAVAVENVVKTDNGSVVFFDIDGTFLNRLTVGALPDMLTFTPNGHYLLVANEGEPNDLYTIDPEGSISIIKTGCPKSEIKNMTQEDVRTAAFRQFNNATLDPRIRIFGPGATVAQDLEPEYIAVSGDSRKAWVALQENNAFAVVDILKAEVKKLIPLGVKDHDTSHGALDVSNRDNQIHIAPWPVSGMYQPDAIAFYHTGGENYIVTANEGDSRDYDGFSEEKRVKDLLLDPSVFPDAADLQLQKNLGRLKVTNVNGDVDNDGDYDRLYSYGTRSFSIWDEEGNLIFDSGSDFETITADFMPDYFNSNNDDNDSFDGRSDDKGPEPEALALAGLSGLTYAFIGLERVGGIMVYDITDPYHPDFIQYINNRDFSVDAASPGAGDLGPEGMAFVPSWKSPTFKPLLIVANEVSGTTTIYEISMKKSDD